MVEPHESSMTAMHKQIQQLHEGQLAALKQLSVLLPVMAKSPSQSQDMNNTCIQTQNYHRKI
jgi:hypothetical protein